jgi:organic hydroperoxide reductase OsmC/OhrA
MPRPRTDYRIELHADGTLATERDTELEVPSGWTPEHLLLAALTRCSLLAFDYHAKRAALEVAGTGSATGSVDRRLDGSWAFVGIECTLDVSLEPTPPRDEVVALVERAERGCFIGSSLEPRPRYHWRINGEDVA